MLDSLIRQASSSLSMSSAFFPLTGLPASRNFSFRIGTVKAIKSSLDDADEDDDAGSDDDDDDDDDDNEVSFSCGTSAKSGTSGSTSASREDTFLKIESNCSSTP